MRKGNDQQPTEVKEPILPDLPPLPKTPFQLELLPPPGTSPIALEQLHDNAMKYDRCTMDPKELSELKTACDKIEKLEKDTKLYSKIAEATGLERWAIAGIHYRENSSLRTDVYLHNGQTLGTPTTIVPKGVMFRKDQFMEACVDAITRELKSKGWKKAPIGIADTLAFTERYNGLGYRNHGIDSAYNWGGTSEEDRGGYPSDGKWDPNREETRIGVVAIMKEMLRRELERPANTDPVPEVINHPPEQIYDKLLTLVRTTDLKPDAVMQLIAYHRVHMPEKSLKNWAVMDYGKHSSKRRFYLFDTINMQVTQLLASHGAGSDTNADGTAEKFSNVEGSHMSSLGIARCSETYQSMGETRLRLDGLQPSNSKLRPRAIVMHSAAYVNETSGRCGMSWGCIVLDKRYLGRVVDQLRGGSLLNLYKS